MDFRDYFKLPLRSDPFGIYTLTNDGHMCAMMILDMPEHEKETNEIIKVINGEMSPKEVEYLKGKRLIYKGDSSGSKIIDDVTGKTFIIIRGWGYLTSSNKCNLTPEDAAKVQDDFGKYIVEKLNQ